MEQMRRELVVFDLDGTLVDSVFVCARLVNEMLVQRRMAAEVTVAQVRRWISVGGVRMIRELLGAACVDPELDLREFRGRYRELPTPHESLFPGVRAGLLALREAGHRLAICSSKPQALCDKVLSELQLAGLFEAVVGGDGAPAQKPDPAHLDFTLGQLGGDRAACVYVGDSEVDLALARNASVPLILVGYGYGDFEPLPEGVAFARHFNEVPLLVTASRVRWS